MISYPVNESPQTALLYDNGKTTGDIHILPMFLEACENFTPMSGADQDALIASAPEKEAVTIFD